MGDDLRERALAAVRRAGEDTALSDEAVVDAVLAVVQPEIERAEAERDRARDLAARLEGELAETVARVEALAKSWRYKGEFGWRTRQEGYGPSPEDDVLDGASRGLLAALHPERAETREVEHIDDTDICEGCGYRHGGSCAPKPPDLLAALAASIEKAKAHRRAEGGGSGE